MNRLVSAAAEDCLSASLDAELCTLIASSRLRLAASRFKFPKRGRKAEKQRIDR